jgi:glycosyltransferase involved in cell wall biosynthesis
VGVRSGGQAILEHTRPFVPCRPDAPPAGVSQRDSQVAVVIPTRDRPDLIERALRSVLAQRLPPVEVWVVDDASVEPLSLPPELTSSVPVHVVRLDSPRGAGAARNEGVARSTAPFLAFLDDDDEWLPDKLAVQVPALEAAPPNVAGVDCGYELWDDGRFTRVVVPPRHAERRRLLLERPTMHLTTLLLRRTSFNAVGGIRTDLARTEDWEFSLRLTDRFAIRTVPEVLAIRYRAPRRPEELLHAYRTMVEILMLRIRELPPAERNKVLAWHKLIEGTLLAEAGRRGEARDALWRAWRLDRHLLRPIPQLLRTVVGNRAWRGVISLRDGYRRRQQGAFPEAPGVGRDRAR